MYLQNNDTQIHIHTIQPQVHTIKMAMPLLRHLVPASHPGGLGSIPGQTSKICSGQCGNGIGFTVNTCFSLPKSFHEFSVLEFLCLPSHYIGLVMDSNCVMKQKWEYSIFCCILVFPLQWRNSAVTFRYNYPGQNSGHNCSKTTHFSQSHFLHCHLQYDISSNYWEAAWTPVSQAK